MAEPKRQIEPISKVIEAEFDDRQTITIDGVNYSLSYSESLTTHRTELDANAAQALREMTANQYAVPAQEKTKRVKEITKQKLQLGGGFLIVGAAALYKIEVAGVFLAAYGIWAGVSELSDIIRTALKKGE